MRANLEVGELLIQKAPNLIVGISQTVDLMVAIVLPIEIDRH